jgi:hypothetical protein
MKILFLLLLLPLNLLAHPVIYQGGTAINSSNMKNLANHYVLYSLTSKFSFGVEDWRFAQRNFLFAKANTLLYRKNSEHSQGNLYLHSGFGTESTYQLGLEGDWETRRLYTSFKHLEFSHERLTQGRVGFAPYLADFSELQTWIMLQGMVTRLVEKEVILTPMLRFFYQNYLAEVGSSVKGEWMLNFMVHI